MSTPTNVKPLVVAVDGFGITLKVRKKIDGSYSVYLVGRPHPRLKAACLIFLGTLLGVSVSPDGSSVVRSLKQLIIEMGGFVTLRK